MSGTFDIAVAWDDSWKINGLKAKRQTESYLYNCFDTGSGHLDLNIAYDCPYCNHKLLHKSHKQYEGKDNKYIKVEDEPWTSLLSRHYILSTCAYCSHWIINGYEAATNCGDSNILLSAASVTAKFSTTSPHGCSEELAQHLRRKPELWHQLAPHRMETLVTDIFKANHRHCCKLPPKVSQSEIERSSNFSLLLFLTVVSSGYMLTGIRQGPRSDFPAGLFPC